MGAWPCIQVAYCGLLWLPRGFAAPRAAARPRESSPSSLLWALLVPAVTITSKGKRDKTGPFTQPQSEGMRTSKISPAFSGSRDADLIFHFGNFDSQICKAQAQPFREFGPISLPGAGATIAHPHVQIPMRRSIFSHM